MNEVTAGMEADTHSVSLHTIGGIQGFSTLAKLEYVILYFGDILGTVGGSVS